MTSPAGSFSSTVSFHVRSHRNTYGFSFHNFDLSDVGYDDLTEVFGKDQTYLTFTLDPCDPIPFLPSCPIFSISTVPTRWAIWYWRLPRRSTPVVSASRWCASDYSRDRPRTAISHRRLGAARARRALSLMAYRLRTQSLAQLSAEVMHPPHWLSSVIEGLATAPFAGTQVKRRSLQRSSRSAAICCCVDVCK